MRKNLMLLLAAFSFAVIFTSCSKDDDSKGTDPSTSAKPSIASKTTLVTLPAPMVASQNPQVQAISGMLTSFNGISAYTASLSVPAGAATVSGSKKSAGITSYKWTSGNYTVYWEYSETAALKAWTIYYQIGTAERFKSVYAEESTDGKTGKLIAYAGQTSATATATWTWNIDASENVKYTFKSATMEMEATVNKNGSGELSIFETNFTYHAIWNVDGHGTLTYTVGEESTDITF